MARSLEFELRFDVEIGILIELLFSAHQNKPMLMNDIPTMNPNEGGDNKSSNESNYFIDETSTFETNMVFSLRQDLIDWVQNVGRGIGYIIIIKNSRRNYNVVFQYDRGDLRKILQEILAQKKINCPFKLEGRYTAADDSWKVKMVCEMHNHQPALYLEGHPYPRRLTEDETRLVEDLLEKMLNQKIYCPLLKNKM
ncbi:hypothetical protein LXL04_003354 [Taraxacum kok-saghyz]